MSKSYKKNVQGVKRDERRLENRSERKQVKRNLNDGEFEKLPEIEKLRRNNHNNGD